MSTKPLIPDKLVRVFRYVDAKSVVYVQELSDVIGIRSVQEQPEERRKMTGWFEKRFTQLGAHTEMCNVVVQGGGDDGMTLTPTLLVRLGKDVSKKTLFVYAHVDVAPTNDSGTWSMTLQDGEMSGPGVCGSKMALLAWCHVIEVYQALGVDLPVNLHFLVEAMNCEGSPGLSDMLHARRSSILGGVKAACIVGLNKWLGRKRPCLVFAQRGTCSFSLQVKQRDKAEDGGSLGGALCQPLADCLYLLARLRCASDWARDVVPLTPEEEAVYAGVEVDIDAMRLDVGATRLETDDKVSLLMKMWRYPSVTVHGVVPSAISTGVPGHVTAHFSIQIVPNQSPRSVCESLQRHVVGMCKQRGVRSRVELTMTSAQPPWAADPCSPVYRAAQQAAEIVHRQHCDMIRYGGGDRIVTLMQEAIGATPLVLIAVAKSDDKMADEDKMAESLSVKSYIDAHKMLAAFIEQFALVKK